MLQYIFYDMDDTLVKTRSKWIAAVWAYVKVKDLPLPYEAITTLLGKNCRDICIDLDNLFHHMGREGIDFNTDELRHLLQQEFEKEPPVEIPGATLFIRTMGRHCQQYVVSGSPLRVVTQVMVQKEWSPYLRDAVSSESVGRGKPDPEVYDTLRMRLQATEAECLIFEDSPAGVEAARRAGIRCICINPHVPVQGSEFLLYTAPDFTTLLANPHIMELMDSDIS